MKDTTTTDLTVSGGTVDEQDDGNLPDTPGMSSGMDDRLWRISERTRIDGRTETEVVDWMPDDYGTDVPRLRFEHPLDEDKTVTVEFDMPKGDTPDQELVRFLEEYGLSLKTAGEVEGFEIIVEYDEDQQPMWQPVVPEHEPSKSEKATEAGKTAGSKLMQGLIYSTVTKIASFVLAGGFVLFTWPVSMFPVLGWVWKESTDNSDESPVASVLIALMVGSIAAFLFWMTFAAFDAVTFELLFESGIDSEGEWTPVWEGI